MEEDKVNDKTIELLNEIRDFVLTTIKENGDLRSTVVSLVHNKGLEELYFTTTKSSIKVQNIARNNKVALAGLKGDNMISLSGKAEIIENQKVKEKIWNPFIEQHFPNGITDPECVVIKFKTKEGNTFIDYQPTIIRY